MLHEFNEKGLSITEDGAPILTCAHDSDVARPPYLHPLYAPNGEAVTDDTSIGHQHPPGICFTRGTINGTQLDPMKLRARRRQTPRDFLLSRHGKIPQNRYL